MIYAGNSTVGYNRYVWSTFATPSGVNIASTVPFIGSAGSAQLTAAG